ncbi:MAG TPA: phosphopantetheine-binding protein [Sphingomonas sp.]|jgi:acyl carrier protein|uniref:phosphopantetheine-binding protein n=1 Tax=Sphingomonas sp. TaxID=28214 RepID=UPI002EDAD3D8
MSIADRVRAIIDELLPASAAPVDAQTLSDRGADFADLVAIEVEIEAAFGVRLPLDDALDETTTISAVIAQVEVLVAARGEQVTL